MCVHLTSLIVLIGLVSICYHCDEIYLYHVLPLLLHEGCVVGLGCDYHVCLPL